MKTDKDIMIDSLMARIRELEQQLNYSAKTNHLAKSTRTNTLLSGDYVEVTGVDDIFYKSIDDLYTSVRIRNCLRAENIYSIGQLVCFSDSAILKTPNLNKKSLDEIEGTLKDYGLWLGMTEQDKIDFSNN